MILAEKKYQDDGTIRVCGFWRNEKAKIQLIKRKKQSGTRYNYNTLKLSCFGYNSFLLQTSLPLMTNFNFLFEPGFSVLQPESIPILVKLGTLYVDFLSYESWK
jgi:hypothetical protein